MVTKTTTAIFCDNCMKKKTEKIPWFHLQNEINIATVTKSFKISEFKTDNMPHFCCVDCLLKFIEVLVTVKLKKVK